MNDIPNQNHKPYTVLSVPCLSPPSPWLSLLAAPPPSPPPAAPQPQALIPAACVLCCAVLSPLPPVPQAEVAGCAVTWLVPHQLAQVLPADVDYTVLLTFLEFYTTLLQFVMFKLYHNLGLRWVVCVAWRGEGSGFSAAGFRVDPYYCYLGFRWVGGWVWLGGGELVLVGIGFWAAGFISRV